MGLTCTSVYDHAMETPGVPYFVAFALLFAAGVAAIIVPLLWKTPAGPERDSMRGVVASDGALSTRAKVIWGCLGGLVCAMSLVAIIVGATR